MQNYVKCVIFLYYILFCCLISSAQQDSKIDWKSDIENFRVELPKKHKDLFFKYSKTEFNSNLDQLANQCESLSDIQIALRLQQIIVKVGDAHTVIDYKQFLGKNRNLPFSVLWLSDGLSINLTTKQNKIILGSKLMKINGFPIETVIDSLSSLFVVDNEASKFLNIPRMISNYKLLSYFGFISEAAPEIEVQSVNGNTFTHKLLLSELSAGSLIELKADTTPFYQSHTDLFFTEKYFEEDSIYFVQYNKCWSRELEEQYGDKEKAKQLPSFAEFEQTVFTTFKEKPIKKLIVDLRFNSGGSSQQGTEFIKQIAEYNEINKQDVIYVVIGRRTFSSGILNVLDFKRYTLAKTIGEDTAGKPNHFGEVKTFKLPSSNITVAYSTKYFNATSENENTIAPDIKCPLSFSDYKNGIDPVYQFVRKQ